MSGVNMQAIYDRLATAPRYHPMSAETFADWAMEAGDVVTVSRDGTEYKSPVGTSTLKWNGKQKIEISSEGSRERDAVSKVSARKYAKGGGGSSGMTGAQELYYDMWSEDGRLNSVISATAGELRIEYNDLNNETNSRISQTASEIRLEVKNTKEGLESSISQTASEIRTEINNTEESLGSRINQTDRSVSLSVGRIKYTSTITYNTVKDLPSTGKSGVLYKISSSGRNYIWNSETKTYQPASYDSESGDINYIKTGEIAIAFNEQTGRSEARLNADVVYAGRGAETIADLELPDWMDTTSGLIAQKATIVDLNAVKARVSTLETDYLKTSELSSKIADIDLLTVNAISVKGGTSLQGTLTVGGAARFSTIAFGNSVGATNFSDCVIDASVSGNTLTLTKAGGGKVTFSKATSLSGSWSSGKLTVSASPQGNTYVTNVKGGTPYYDSGSGKWIANILHWETDESRASGTGKTIDVQSAYDAGHSAGVTDGENEFTSMGSNCKSGLTQLADANGSKSNQFTLYMNRNGSYVSVGTHYWYYASTTGLRTLYAKN